MSKLSPPSRVLATTTLPSIGIRRSSLIAGANQAVDVLRDRQPLLLRRHVFVVHTLVDDAPRGAAIGARPNAGGRDADADVVGVARIDQHRADAGLLATRHPHPLPPFRHEPQRLVQRPGLAAVIGTEE